MSESSTQRDRGASFGDVQAALRRLHRQGESDSPQATMLRVLWLRSEHADARIETELTHLRDDLVVARAAITLTDGAAASGYAAEPLERDDLSAAIERSETRAIGRALDVLGYIVAPEQSLAGQPVPEPVNRDSVADTDEPVSPGQDRDVEPAPVRAAASSTPTMINAIRNVPLRARTRGGMAERTAPAGVDPRTGEIIGPEDTPAPRAAEPVPTRPRPARAETTDDTDELPLEDYSWTHFWRWARSHGLTNKAQVEERLGHTIDGRNPGDVRAELRELGIPLD